VKKFPTIHPYYCKSQKKIKNTNGEIFDQITGKSQKKKIFDSRFAFASNYKFSFSTISSLSVYT